jgi:ABC-type lipoprotein release transport system permease subunit
MGMGIGLPAAFASTRLLSTLLYGTKPADPITFGAICLLFPLVAIAASLIPARRALRVDSQTALRD